MRELVACACCSIAAVTVEVVDAMPYVAASEGMWRMLKVLESIQGVVEVAEDT